MLFSRENAWKFQNESSLEAFIWENLSELLNLTGLARQYSINHQVCDILVVDRFKQLTIIELKNTSDRYVIQQLTRYFDAVITEKPFSEQIDYQKPIRLVAIALDFHAYNLIDQTYHRLDFSLYTFKIALNNERRLHFELKDWKNEHSPVHLEIPQKFQSLICPADESIPISATVSLAPPKALRTLIEALPPRQQTYVLSIREQLLSFDESMAELGKTTRTQYGLRKGKQDVYQTKLCADFIPVTSGVLRPRLRLRLPYPKREFGAPGRTYKLEPVKGLTWVEVKHTRLWDSTTDIQLLFYFGKTCTHYSYSYDLRSYSKVYCNLTGQNRPLESM